VKSEKGDRPKDRGKLFRVTAKEDEKLGAIIDLD
jgi:hypothetical protein